MGRMRGLVRAILLLVVVSAPAAAQTGWESFGPPLFQVTDVATSVDEGTVYASSADTLAGQSALFKSVDAGHTWSTLVQAATGEFYGDVLVDPASPSTVYTGSLGNDGMTRIYRSIDAGVTWTLGLTIPDYCVPSFIPGNAAGKALLSCGTALWKTADAGMSWQAQTVPFTESTRLTVGPANSLYAYGPTTLFISNDGGTSWQTTGAVPPCPAMNVLAADPLHPNSLIAGTGELGTSGLACGGIYLSGDGGYHWTAGSLAGVFVTDVALDTLDPTRAYASASALGSLVPKGGVWSSTDRGASWQDASLPTNSASRLALAKSGTVLYAATPLGVYEASTASGPSTCTSDAFTLCLDQSRFRVQATWTRSDGSSGFGHAAPLTGDTGDFWFFTASNVEVIVKVLEGCTTNSHRWVFASGLTNVLVNLTVTDVVTGTTKTYTNPQSTPFASIQDTSAFPCN